MLNRVVLVGRLCADPEVRFTPSGVPVAQLRIAVNRYTKNEQGDYETDFFDVVAWRRNAEFAQSYLTKGRLVSVEGRLQTRSWVDQTTSQKRIKYEIVADGLEGLDRKGDNETGSSSAQPSRPMASAAPSSSASISDDDERDPFADE